MILTLPWLMGVLAACGPDSVGELLPCAASPWPPSFSTVAFSCVTVWPPTLPPITMARSTVAMPGIVIVLSMLVTEMSSAQACLSGKTRMTIFSLCTAAKAVAAVLSCDT